MSNRIIGEPIHAQLHNFFFSWGKLAFNHVAHFWNVIDNLAPLPEGSERLLMSFVTGSPTTNDNT
jgi:hypothetical protein